MEQHLIAAESSRNETRGGLTTLLRNAIRIIILLAAWGLHPTLAPAQDGTPAMKEVRLVNESFVRDNNLPSWAKLATTIPDTGRSDPVVMRLAETQFRVEARPEVVIRRVMQVNEAAGLASTGQHQIVFQPDYQQVRLHAFRIFRGQQVIDKLAAANVRFVQRERDVDNAVFTGWVTAVIVADDLRVGDSLEVTYSIMGDNPIFKGKFFDATQWDSIFPVVLRSITIDAPRDRAIQYRLIGAAPTEAVPLQVTSAGDRRVMRFEARDLPPVDIDPYLPVDSEPLRWLQFSEFQTWRDVARWATELFPTTSLPADFAPLLAGLRKLPNDGDRVMKALAFVQNDIRYVSMSLGENSHRPFSPAEVFARRYGDCKDKSLLLISILRQLGIQAEPVLLSTQYRQSLDTLLPSPLDFNHVITRVRISGRTYFLDPTLRDQVGHLDHIGQAQGNSQVLVVASESDQLERVPPAPEELITTLRREHVTIEKLDEPATMDVQLYYAGLDAESFRGAMVSLRPEQVRKHYAGAFDRRYAGAQLIGEPVMHDDQEKNRVTINLRYNIPRLVESDGDQWFTRYQASNLTEQFYVPDSARRSQALALPSYPTIRKYEFELTLPEDFDASRRPQRREIASGPVTFTQEASMKGRTALARVTLRVLADRIGAPDVPRFLDDLRRANSLLNGTFAFDKGDLKTAAQQVPFKQATQEALERLIRATSDIIANGGLSGRDVSSAHCERALAHGYLGHRQEALQDAGEALRRQPNLANILKCHGTVEYLVGNLATSHEDLSRAISMGLADADTRFQRGLVGYYQGRFSDAADDFAAARKAAATTDLEARAEYWRLLSMRRAGLPATASSLSWNEWPGVAVRLLSGIASTEEVLEKAHQHTGYALELALTEANLYLGQFYLLKGERFKALAYFNRAAEKQALHSLLHHAIARERVRLTP